MIHHSGFIAYLECIHSLDTLPAEAYNKLVLDALLLLLFSSLLLTDEKGCDVSADPESHRNNNQI